MVCRCFRGRVFLWIAGGVLGVSPVPAVVWRSALALGGGWLVGVWRGRRWVLFLVPSGLGARSFPRPGGVGRRRLFVLGVWGLGAGGGLGACLVACRGRGVAGGSVCWVVAPVSGGAGLVVGGWVLVIGLSGVVGGGVPGGWSGGVLGGWVRCCSRRLLGVSRWPCLGPCRGGFLVSVPVVSPGLLALFGLVSVAVCVGRGVLLVLWLFWVGVWRVGFVSGVGGFLRRSVGFAGRGVAVGCVGWLFLLFPGGGGAAGVFPGGWVSWFGCWL